MGGCVACLSMFDKVFLTSPCAQAVRCVGGLRLAAEKTAMAPGDPPRFNAQGKRFAVKPKKRPVAAGANPTTETTTLTQHATATDKESPPRPTMDQIKEMGGAQERKDAEMDAMVRAEADMFFQNILRRQHGRVSQAGCHSRGHCQACAASA